MVLENLLEIINELNRSEVSISNRKKTQPLSLVDIEYHPEDRVQFNGFYSVVEYQQHLMNAHESFKHLLQQLEGYEFTKTCEIMRLLKMKIDELATLFDPAHDELRFVPVVMNQTIRLLDQEDYLERVKKKTTLFLEVKYQAVRIFKKSFKTYYEYYIPKQLRQRRKKSLDQLTADINEQDVKLEWRKGATALGELIFALHRAEAFGKGVPRSDITAWFSKHLNISLKNIEGLMSQAKARKIQRVRFLNELSEEFESFLNEKN